MNTIEHSITQVKNFFESPERGLLLTGTNEDEKHKLIMILLGKLYKDKRILVRSHHMNRLNLFFGWAGLKKTPQIGKGNRLINNIYYFDTIYRPDTWNKTANSYDFALLYPFDILVSKGEVAAIDDLFKKAIPKIILATHDYYSDYAEFNNYFSHNVEFDKMDETEHNRIMQLRQEHQSKYGR